MLNERTKRLQRWIAPIWILLILGAVAGPFVAASYVMWRTYGDSGLVAAASSGDTAEARARLQAGSPADSFHPEGSSALWWAVNSGSRECVELLLRYGADPNHGGQWSTLAEEAVGRLDYDDGKPRLEIVKTPPKHADRFRDPREVELLKSALANATRSEPSGRKGAARATRDRQPAPAPP